MIPCRTVWQLIDELARGTLDERNTEQLRNHLRDCRECEAEFDLELRLLRIGSRAPAYDPPADFAATVVAEWSRDVSAELASPWGIARKVLSEALGVLSDTFLLPFLPAKREMEETLAFAKQALCEASEIVAETLKQIIFGRFVSGNT